MFFNFGRFFGFGMQSKMDTLLKQDNLTLETILNEEDILPELRNSSSGKFADFIIQHPNEYNKMIHYITNDVTDQHIDTNICIKYPFFISEILGSENEKLINFLFEKQGDTSQEEIQNPLEDQPTESQTQEFQNDNEKVRQMLLPDLLSILENDSILITSAGYFTKIITAIIHKRGFDFWEYLKNNPRTISNLFKHANIRHITEIFEKLIVLDTLQEEHEQRLFIEERQQLISRLIKFLTQQSYSSTIITNICESLIEVYKRALLSLDAMPQLREILLAAEKPQYFLNLALQSQNNSVYYLLNIQYEFYSKMSQLEDKHYEIDFPALYTPILDISVEALNQQDLLRASFQTTYGAIIKPLGDQKLSLISLIIQLIQKSELASLIVKGQLFQQIINLVIAFPTNNQLHILFEKLVVAIVDSNNEHLHELFFEDTNFLKFIITNNGSQERLKKYGYKGILTKLTNFINSPKVLSQHQIIQTAINSIQNEWLKYIEELKDINEIEQSWLLGVNPRFREQINVESFSPPLSWPEPLGSEQYRSINNTSSQTNDNQQQVEEDNSNDNQTEEREQQAEQFEQEETQAENQVAVEVVQVKEEIIESQEEQQYQHHEVQIVDSPIYVENPQQQEQNENIPEQKLEESHEQQQQVDQQQETTQKEEQQQEITQKEEQQQEVTQQEEQQQEKIQQVEQQQQQEITQKVEQEQQQQQNELSNEQQNLLKDQPQLEEQQNLQQNQTDEQPKLEEQQIQQQAQAEDQKPDLQTENQEPQEQNKQPQDEA